MSEKRDDERKLDRRVNSSLVAATEHRVLVAITTHLPRWVRPNHLTGLGVFGAIVVMIGYQLSNSAETWLWLSNLGLVLHWLGDSLDGTLARQRAMERHRYGFYIDQVIDTVCSLIIALGAGFCFAIRLDLALLVLIIFQMLSIQLSVRAIVDREFHVAAGRLGPTEMRLGMLTMNLAIMAFGAPNISIFGTRMSWVDLLMLITSVGLLLLFLYQMHIHLVRLNIEDPEPQGPA